MRYPTLFCLLWLAFSLGAQSSALNQGNALLARFSYGPQWPGEDLAARFGNSLSLGLGADFLTQKSNLIFGLQGSFIFGNEVKTPVLEPLRTEEGFLIGNDRDPADIQLRQRGFYLGGHVGKLFSLSSSNPRSGIRVTLGAGLLQHKIRIQQTVERTVPQLTGDYEKGYDRLTNGLALRQFIGYQLLSSNRRINFYAGFEFIQGFTQNRRDFNFDTRSRDTESRLDLLYSLRIGWILPFYFGQAADEIYY